MWHCICCWPGSASDIWGTWEVERSLFLPQLPWSLAWLPNLVCNCTNLIPGRRANWRVFCSISFSLSSPPRSHCPLNDTGLAVFDIMSYSGSSEGACCSLWYSLLIVLLEVFNLKQLSDWPYSKIALMAALKQPLQWWTERQRRKLSTKTGTLQTTFAAREKCSPFTFLNLALAFSTGSAANRHLPTNNTSTVASRECSGQIGSTAQQTSAINAD